MNSAVKSVIAIAAVALCSRATESEDAHVTNQTILSAPFYVAGFEIRTNNADEAADNSKIGPLWQRFMQQNLAAQIANRADAALTVVYSQYASDEKGDYNYLLGARVTSVEHLPAGMTSVKVEPGSYAVVLTEAGPMPGVLQKAWRAIWNMSDTQLGGKRAFVTDYEIYDQRSADPQHAQVEIHLALKTSTDPQR